MAAHAQESFLLDAHPSFLLDAHPRKYFLPPWQSHAHANAVSDYVSI